MAVPQSMTLSYMHRDAGNYKTFGNVTLVNDLELSFTNLETELRLHLIDGEYFYPSKWGLPNLNPVASGISESEDWNEFLCLEEGAEVVDLSIPVSKLILNVKGSKENMLIGTFASSCHSD